MCSGSQKIALWTAIIGILGPARTLGVSTQLSAEAERVGLSQGQLSGDRANLIAILKVVGPLLYGQLFVQGEPSGCDYDHDHD